MMALVDFLNTTTDMHRGTKETVDLIYKQRRFLELLKSKGNVKSGVGGIESRIPWETTEITSASINGWDGGNADLPTYAADDLLESGSFPWYYAYGVTFQVDNELVKNQGAEEWISIAKTRYNGLVKRMSKYMEVAMLLHAGANTTTDNIMGLPSFMNNSDTDYGGGLDLTDDDLGPKIIAIGATLPNLALSHLNQAFTSHSDGVDSFDAIISEPDFLGQMRDLVMPDQVYNSGGGNWSIGPLGLNWFGKVPIQTTNYLEGEKVCYCLRMNTIHLEWAWPGDGVKSTGWYSLPTKIGTMVLVLKLAVRSFCDFPWANKAITWA
jgi:hypothetical protein